jgi:hypothetical protein
MELGTFKRHVARFTERSGTAVLGYLSAEPDGTMTYTMSRYPDFRTTRPPMPSVAECDETARQLADSLGGSIVDAQAKPGAGLRAIIGLREGGYEDTAAIQDIQAVRDALPGTCTITPSHMVSSRFEYQDGRIAPDDYDEPVAMVEAGQVTLLRLAWPLTPSASYTVR